MPNAVIDNLRTQLDPSALALFDAVIAEAELRNLRAYLVGGTVRDLLLNRRALDIDITIEGDAVAFAKEIGDKTGATLKKTTPFGTAELLVAHGSSPGSRRSSNNFRLDLATARAETYARPGALPKTRPSTIDDDLLRRDFTINAIALEITRPAPGKLLDPTGGAGDINARLVRVLHGRSLRDDATRIIRAARYAARFDFRIEESTRDLITRDISYLDKISGTRLRQELTRVFAEENPAPAVALLGELGVLRAIHPSLEAKSSWFESTEPHDPAVAFALLAHNASDSDARDLSRRLALTRKQADAVAAMPRLREIATTTTITPTTLQSELARHLAAIPDAALIAYSIAGQDDAARAIAKHRVHAKDIRPILRGDDIIELGVEQGPDIADVLARLRAARLDGDVATREDEVRFVEAYLARELVGLD
jgi:tRNA nucleotidyltransferase (CCA-adding enzyme)